MSDEYEDLNVTYPGAASFKFGDSEHQSGVLLALVREGKKRATCDALSMFEAEPGSMPVVGRCDIAQNWDGTPALVIRTLKVEQVRFCDVTEEMALAEGENHDLWGWRRDHETYFRRHYDFSPEMMLVFEHFEVVEDLAERG
ncbi:MAG: ASCH domain-containing protein [Boseongicola sp.]|nr:ASCH domain-containing protein [Boseongicola sp.]NNJ67871.1 ASCH domain-containing protein [Boseongicola sp.]